MVTSKQEQKWQAESDAHTLAQYQEIMSDKARMNRAVKMAEKRAQELTKSANMMQRAANVKSTAKRGGRKK